MSKKTFRKSKNYTTYTPLKRSTRSRLSRNSPLSSLSPNKGSYDTLEDIYDDDSNILTINENEYANKLKFLFMEIDKELFFERFEKYYENKLDLIQNKNYNLAPYNFKKDLIHPTTIINIMSKLNNLNITKYDTMRDNPDVYISYGSTTLINYLLTIFDTLNIKVLYLINHDNTLYLSPLNIRNTRDAVRKNTFIETIEYIKKNNIDLHKKFHTKLNRISIDAKSYDMIIMMEAFHMFLLHKNNIKIDLNNFDILQNHRASILRNNNNKINEGHIISINKCNNYTILNTTWKPFNIYNIDNFQPGRKQFYHIDKSTKFLNEVSVNDIMEYDLEYYYSQFIDELYINHTENIHLFISKFDHSGGSIHIKHSKTIPEVSVCSDIYFPQNLQGFCWFASIVNSLFFADDISVIFLNKAVLYIDRSLEYIKAFYDTNYATFDVNNTTQFKEFIKHLIYLFTYIYCSFSILSKNKINHIKEKQKWYNAYIKITDTYYDYIYIYIIVLSKTMKDI
jgi:hypothetical protein